MLSSEELPKQEKHLIVVSKQEAMENPMPRETCKKCNKRLANFPGRPMVAGKQHRDLIIGNPIIEHLSNPSFLF